MDEAAGKVVGPCCTAPGELDRSPPQDQGLQMAAGAESYVYYNGNRRWTLDGGRTATRIAAEPVCVRFEDAYRSWATAKNKQSLIRNIWS